ncbi:nitroreductase family protein [Propionicicella superfundia]|uniref:nitroreductase family protein n=1 Tax=Propionicicella superfundia TaxID=348582 RepID=UPI0003F87524|nr:nitroreductase family protein [Propionicicella superfundia]
MIPDGLFADLIAAARRAPSPDNMQAWVFARAGDAIEARLEPSRVLPTDVNAMFAWVGLGAAVENLVIAARHAGRDPEVEPGALGRDTPVIVRLGRAGEGDALASVLHERRTDRGAFEDRPLDTGIVAALTGAAAGLAAGVHWAAGRGALDRMATMDAASTYIRLEHRPLHDELFEILRFTRHDIETTGFGLEFEALGVPGVLVWMGRLMRHAPVVGLVSRLGIGRLVARRLADRLRHAGALCLVTARRADAAGYVEAGRAMERIWLAATARGLAVQPHGVMPQYLTKAAVEPETFGRYAEVIRAQQDDFDAVFPAAVGEHPAIVLRIGWASEATARRSVRLPADRLIREGRRLDETG